MSGRHFLQIPGPTNVPNRVLRAMARPTMDHRGPAFAAMGREALDGVKKIFKTDGPVVIYSGSGTGAWEAALVNTLSPGDKVLMFETGHFAALWRGMAAKLGLDVDFVPGDWRHGVDPDALQSKLESDRGHAIKAVAAVPTRRRLASRAGSPRCAGGSTPPDILRSFWWTRCRRWGRWISGTTSGASTYPSPARRKG